MINPGTYNITAYQGATYTLTLTWTVNDTPVNLTGYTAAMQVRQSPSATSTIFSLSNGSGITLGGSAGTIAIAISATDMANTLAGKYVYDLELNSGSEITRLVQGTFTVQAEVTRT